MGMRHRDALRIVGIAGAIGLATASIVESAPADLAELLGAANLVMQGKASKVEYRVSQPGSSGRGTPYTFVTYTVSSVLRGDTSTRTVTLRFVGGPDGQGRFLTVTHVPVFQVGDEDILFIRGNDGSGCPLVGCSDGRFRLLDGAVHDAYGSPVRGLSGGRAVSTGVPPAAFRTFRYPAPDFDELIKNPDALAAIRAEGLTVDAARRRYKAEASPFIEITTTFSGPAGQLDSPGTSGAGAAMMAPRLAAAAPVQATAFRAAIASLSAAAPARFASVRSADASAAIPAERASPVAPPRAPVAAQTPARSAADIAEEASIPKADFSLVRRKRQ